MKTIIIALVSIMISTQVSQAQIRNAKTDTVKVYGDCMMCKTTIEKAAYKKKVSMAEWNEDTKVAVITYDSSKTNADAILKSIALVGYDNDKFLAPNETYNKLPGCCKYERTAKSPGVIPAAMGNKKDDHSSHTGSEMQHNTQSTGGTGNDHTAPAAGTQNSNQFKELFDHYFSMKDALVKSDATAAAMHAGFLLTSISSVKMESMGAKQHSVWMEKEKNIKIHAQHIADSKDMAHQREQFSLLSKGMYAIIKESDSGTPVYWQNCPMYNDGKGANWLSKESSIRNPYYGSMMLSCGKTIETIK